MSDGPHRTLPMRPSWRKLAERADNENYTPGQVAETIVAALAVDWRTEVTESFLEAVADCIGDTPQPGLFASAAELVKLRAQCGSPLSALLVDAARDAVADGFFGRQAMERAIADALTERALRGFRQVEEHYLRKGFDRRSAKVRSRLNECADTPGITALARSLAGGAGTAGQSKTTRHDGLNHGVAL